MIIADYLKAIGQIGDPRFLRVLLLGLGLTIALLFGFTVAFAWTIGLLVPDSFSLPWIGEITWVDNLASWAVVPVMFGASIFLMIPVASAFTGVFLDDVADAVEDQHYPGQPPVSRVALAESLYETLKFLGVLLVVNAVALILCLIFAPFAPFIFWGVNGLMLGREYASLVARRRLTPAQTRDFRKRHSMTIWLAGICMAIPLTVPVLNLVVPIIGVAGFTHLFHRLNQTPAA